MKRSISYLDLFSGTGGFAKGFLSAGYSFKKHYFSEIDPYAIANYQYHFRHAQSLGSINDIQGKDLKDIDLITFGSPCQDLSLAGKRRGLRGKRSGLFFEAVRLIVECLPRAFVFENVKGLFSSNSVKDFEVVLKTLADIGLYNLQWQLLNTRWFLPQNRERIYLVGTLAEERTQQIFPFNESDFLPETGRQKGKAFLSGIASAITSNYHKGVHGLGETYISTIDVPEMTKKGYATAKPGDSIDLSYLNSATKANRVKKGYTKTLATTSYQYTIKQGHLRKLTPLECERLQGFPDGWTEFGFFDEEIKPISDTQRYILLGNAVSVPVVKAVANRLIGKEELSGLENDEEMKRKKAKASEDELVLGDIPEIDVPEIQVTYKREEGGIFGGQIKMASDVAKFFRSTFKEDIQLQEQFLILYLGQNNKIIGYYRHSRGGITNTVLDIRLVLSVALKCVAVAMIITHNHPSGNTNPSDSDIRLTNRLKDAAKLLEIDLLDHIILTNDSYYSFADEGLLGIDRGRISKTQPSNTMKAKKNNHIPKIEEKKSEPKPTLVERIPDEIRFIRRFLSLNGKRKSKDDILRFINALHKAILEKKIRKTSAYAHQIEYIQDKLVKTYNTMQGFVHFLITEKLVQELKALTSSQRVIPSVSLIKRYINLNGKPNAREKARNLLKAMDKAIEKKKVGAKDAYQNVFSKMKGNLDRFTRDKSQKTLSIQQTELSGLNGILSGNEPIEESTSLNGPEETSTGSEPTIKNSVDFVKEKFKTLGFAGKYLDFIGDPAPGFTAMVFGAPKMGKSYLCIDFAGYLARNHGKVLYVAKEEKLDSTLQEKLKSKEVAHPYLVVADGLPSDLSKYDSVFLDSVTKLGMSPSDLDRLEKENPNVNFIYIFQSTKTGQARGTNEFMHDVDVVIEVPEIGYAIQRGRFNQGGEMQIFEQGESDQAA